MGLGFTMALSLLGAVREILGNGSLFGIPVFGDWYQPALIMALPPGAFMLIGFIMAGFKVWNQKREKARLLKELEGSEA